MEKVREKLPSVKTMSRREKALVSICIVLAIALLATIGVSVATKASMQREYDAVRSVLGNAMYSDLYMLIQTFDMTTVPNADVRNAVLPQMKNYYTAATTLNEALTNAYGQRYRVLTDADISSLSAAFNAYESAFRSDSPTDLAQADMLACMNRVRDLLSSRFTEGALRPAR